MREERDSKGGKVTLEGPEEGRRGGTHSYKTRYIHKKKGANGSHFQQTPVVRSSRKPQ